MSIFTNSKIEKDSIYVRFYHWSDPNKGWGDAGTKLYTEIPIEYFEEIENKREDGSSYFKYDLDTNKGKEILGDYWWMEYGYEQSSKENLLKEIETLESELNKLKKCL